jgi:hypothetical protein
MIITFSNALKVSNNNFLSPTVLVVILSTVLHPAVPLCIASTQNVVDHLIIVHFQYHQHYIWTESPLPVPLYAAEVWEHWKTYIWPFDIEAPMELPNWSLSQWADDAACSSGCKMPWMALSSLVPAIVTKGWNSGLKRMCVFQPDLHNSDLLPQTNKTLLRLCSSSTFQQRERMFVALSCINDGIAKVLLLNHQNMQRWTMMCPFNCFHFFDWYTRKYFSLIPPSVSLAKRRGILL